MHMWDQLLPKTGQSEWPHSPVDREVYDLLDEANHVVVFELVLYPFMWMDWRGCENIHFTEDETPDDRSNIMFIFSLNQMFIFCLI